MRSILGDFLIGKVLIKCRTALGEKVLGARLSGRAEVKEILIVFVKVPLPVSWLGLMTSERWEQKSSAFSSSDLQYVPSEFFREVGVGFCFKQ